MASASIKMTFTSRLPQVSAAMRQNVAAAVAKATFDVEAKAKAAIQTGSKSGQFYRSGSLMRAGGARNTKALGGLELKRVGGKSNGNFIVGSKSHRASAPGEAPASDTGHLANCIQADTGNTARTLTGEVNVGSEYAAALEFGSPNGKIAARPFLQPSVEAVKEDFERDIAAALKAGG